TPAQQVAAAEPAAPWRQGQLARRGLPPDGPLARRFQEGPRQGGPFGGPPRDGPGSGPPQLLPPLQEIKDPLTDGPLENMFTNAEVFAKENPEKFREILARFEQILNRANGHPIEQHVRKAHQDWSV